MSLLKRRERRDRNYLEWMKDKAKGQEGRTDGGEHNETTEL